MDTPNQAFLDWLPIGRRRLTGLTHSKDRANPPTLALPVAAIYVPLWGFGLPAQPRLPVLLPPNVASCFQTVADCCKPFLLLPIRNKQYTNCCNSLHRPLNLLLVTQTARGGGKRKTKADLVHLRSLATAEPRTKAGWVAWAWPEISAALASGKRMHEVWEALQKDGIGVPYNQFRVYVSRYRKRLNAAPGLAQPEPAVESGAATAVEPPDPLRNLREQRQKKRRAGFEYDPFPDKSLIG